MKQILMAGAMLAGLVAGSPANATVLSYNFSGVFQDGRTLTGEVAFEEAGSVISQFKNFNFTVSGFHTFRSLMGVSYNESAGVNLYSIQSVFGDFQKSGTIYLSFLAKKDGAVLKSIESTSLTTPSFYAEYNDFGATSNRYNIVSSTISQNVAVPAVPEPATWVFMIVGVGAVGGMMRRKRSQTVQVGFA